jgi:DNA polymerase-1
MAGNRLDKLYQHYNARLIVPLHDAFVFEAPLETLVEVAALTERAMCEAIQECFPNLQPRVEVNIQRPDCWNKDGEVEPWRSWVRDCRLTLRTLSLDGSALEALLRNLPAGRGANGNE